MLDGGATRAAPNTIMRIPASTARIRPFTKVLELPPPDEARSGGQSPYRARQTFWPAGVSSALVLPGPPGSGSGS